MAAPSYPVGTHLFGTMFEGFREPIDAIFGRGYGAMIAYISGPLALGITIYIGLIGYGVLRGAIQFPARELLYRGFALAMLWALVTSQYGNLVAQNFYRVIPSEISTALGGTSVEGTGDYFDTLMDRGFRVLNDMAEAQDKAIAAHIAESEANQGTLERVTGDAIRSATGFDTRMSIADLTESFLLGLVMVVTMVLILLCAAIGFTMMIFCLFGLVIVLTLGPIFIAALLFDSTRSWFMSWMNQVINYVVLFVVITLTSTMIVEISERAATLAAERETPMAMAMVVGGFYLVGTFVYFQLPGIAASLAGGGASAVTQFASQALAVASLRASRGLGTRPGRSGQTPGAPSGGSISRRGS